MADKKTNFGKVKAKGLEVGAENVTEAELDLLDGITPGTVAVNKAVVPTTGKTIDELNVTLLKKGGTAITATAAELNALAGVKRYVALLTQTGTGAPVATVLENSLGGTVVWTRNSAGDYTATLSGAFTNNKTVVFVSLRNGDPFIGLASARAFRESNNAVRLHTIFIDYTDNVFTSAGPLDDLLSNTSSEPASIEIRVYP